MSNLKFDHPLKELFKGDIDRHAGKDCRMFAIRFSSLNPYYSFSDFSSLGEEDNINTLDKTIEALKYLKKHNSDVLIESDSGQLSEGVDDLLIAFEKRDKKASKLLHSTYIHMLATDNNNLIVKSVVDELTKNYKDIDHSIVVMEKYNRLIIRQINIPNLFLVDDSFIKNELVNSTKFLKSKEVEINKDILKHGIKVHFSIKEYEEKVIDVTFRALMVDNNENIFFNDTNKDIIDEVFLKYIMPFVSIRQNKVILGNRNGEITFNSQDFRVGLNMNKYLFDGTLGC